MKIRINRNYNKRTDEDLFGLSIRLDNGRLYCKYPVNHQNYKTIDEAKEAAERLSQQISASANLDYGSNGSAGINKAEYVKII